MPTASAGAPASAAGDQRVRHIPAPGRSARPNPRGRPPSGDPQDLSRLALDKPTPSGPKLCDGGAYTARAETAQLTTLSPPDDGEFADIATRGTKTWVLTSLSLYRLKGDQLRELPGSTCTADYVSQGAGMIRHASLAVDRRGVHVGQFRPPNATFSQSLWTGKKWRCGLPPHTRGSGDVSLHDSGGEHWLWLQGSLIRTLPAPYRRLPHAGYLAGPLVHSEVPNRPVSALLLENAAARHRYFDGFRWVERALPGAEPKEPLRIWHEDARQRLWGAAAAARVGGRSVDQPLLMHDGMVWHACRTPLPRIDVVSVRNGVLWMAGARQVLVVDESAPRLVEIPVERVLGIEITEQRSAWVWGTTKGKSRAVRVRLSRKEPTP